MISRVNETNVIMPKTPKQVDKNDPEYLEKRKRNNEAIKKSREKARQKSEETQKKVDSLRKDNKRLEDKINVLGQEMQFLKDIFIALAFGQITNRKLKRQERFVSFLKLWSIRPTAQIKMLYVNLFM